MVKIRKVPENIPIKQKSNGHFIYKKDQEFRISLTEQDSKYISESTKKIIFLVSESIKNIQKIMNNPPKYKIKSKELFKESTD